MSRSQTTSAAIFTRHSHRVRDAVLSTPATAPPSSRSPVTVFAPCLHAAPCPALARDSDWCHEDLDVDLPGWLVPVAKAAGLRHEGLTFSYLVLRGAEGRGERGGLLDRLAAPLGGARLRV